MKKHIYLILSLCLTMALLSGCGTSGSADTEQPLQSDSAQKTESTNAAALVRDIATVQYFTEEAVAEEDIQLILEAGVQSPSAMNGQPWHFSAVTDASVLQQIADGMGGGVGGFSGAAAPPEGMELPEGATPPEGMEIPEAAAPSEGTPSASGSGASTAPNKAGIADAPLAIVISAKAGSEFDAGLACQNMSVEAQLLGYGTKILSSTTMVLNGEKQAEYRELLGIPEDMSAVAVLLVGFADEAAAADAVSSATTRNPTDTVVTYVKAD